MTVLNTETLETSVTMMARIGNCNAPSFSPDGRQIAFLSNLTGLPQVFIVNTTGGWPHLVTSLDDQITAVKWSPDGVWLAIQVAPGGGLNQQIYCVRPDGTDMRLLTDGGKENNGLAHWIDNKHLAFASNRRNPAALDGCMVNIVTGEIQTVFQSKGMGNFTATSADGKWGVFIQLANRGDYDLYLVNMVSGTGTLLTPHEPPGTFFGGYFSPDGKTVYLGSNKDRDTIAFARIDLSSGQPGAIEVVQARDDAEFENLAISNNGRTAALVWNIAGRSELALYDLEKNVVTATPKMPAECIGALTFSPADRYLVFEANGSNMPPDISVMDMHNSHIRQVTHSPHPGVSLDELVAPRLVHFQAHDGLALSGWLYLPHGYQQPGPIVLSFHGGPEAQERPIFDSDYQALLSQGIAVFAPNVRGSEGFGKRFMNLDNGALRVNAVKDIQSCVNYVVKEGIGDAKRIGIMGGSYGGYMTMAGLTEFPDAFAAGAMFYGIVNFQTFFEHTEPWMAEISKVEYGDPDKNADMLRDLSPIHKIDRVQAATIVLHGANDTNVPVVEAEQVVEQLKRRGIPVEYVLFPDEGHGWLKTANRVKSTVAIVKWFVKYLRATNAESTV